MIRLYLCDLEIVSGPRGPSKQPVWRNLLPEVPFQRGQATDTEKLNVWIGELDTTDSQHAILKAAGNVRYVPASSFKLTYGSMSVKQKAALDSLRAKYRYPLAFHTGTVRVSHIIAFLMGMVCFHPIRSVLDADSEIRD